MAPSSDQRAPGKYSSHHQNGVSSRLAGLGSDTSEPSPDSDETSMVRMALGDTPSILEIDAPSYSQRQPRSEEPQRQKQAQETTPTEGAPATDLVQLVSSVMIENRGGISTECSGNMNPALVDTSRKMQGSTEQTETKDRESESEGKEDKPTHQDPASEEIASQGEETGGVEFQVALDSATAIQERPPEIPATPSHSDTQLVPPLPSRSSSKSDEEECSICQNPYTSRSTLQPCGHGFDFKCIMTWLEEVFQTKYDIHELKCPLCRKTIHTIREEGTSHHFDVVGHFRELARDECVHHFFYGVDGLGQVGTEGLHPWERESVVLFGYRLLQQLALTWMMQTLALGHQALEEMGEGASTDVHRGGISRGTSAQQAECEGPQDREEGSKGDVKGPGRTE